MPICSTGGNLTAGSFVTASCPGLDGQRHCFRFGFEYYGRLDLFVIPEPDGVTRLSVFGFHVSQWPGIQGTHRATRHTDGRFLLHPAIQAEIALLHLRIVLSPELGRFVRAGFEALVTLVLAQAEVTVDNDDAVLFSLR